MSAVKFRFSRMDEDVPCGFDLGDVEIDVAGSQHVSSQGHSPSQSMMIYLSLADLLTGASRLCLSRRDGCYEFVGTGSSFILTFRRTRNSFVEIAYRGQAIGETTPRELLSAVFVAANEFLRPKNVLPGDDSVAEDLAEARGDLERALRKIAR